MSRRPLPCKRRTIQAALLTALLAGAVDALAPARASADAASGPQSVFGCFEKGWRARDAVALSTCIDPRGAARFHLLSYPLSQRPHRLKPAQARASLKTYFRKIGGVRLLDVTPERGPATVRLYDYTYKPAGANARTTHLQVRVRQSEKRRWVLASVTESVKPRK